MSRLHAFPLGAGVVLFLPDYSEPPVRAEHRVVRPVRRGRGTRRV